MLTVASESREIQEIRRRYVMKKPGLDPFADGLVSFLAQNFNVHGVMIRTGYRYDIEGLNDEELAGVTPTVFAESPVNDVLGHDEFEIGMKGKTIIPPEPLPGQYDQIADSARKSILLETDKEVDIRVAAMIVIEGEIPSAALQALESYLINPTDSRKASMEMPTTLREAVITPGPIPFIERFHDLDEGELRGLIKKYALAMTLADIKNVQQYFIGKNRLPRETELLVIDTYWSDHCRHTTFTTELMKIALGGHTIVGVDSNDIVKKKLSPAAQAIHRAAQTFMVDRQALYGADADTQKLTLMDLALFSMKEAQAKGLLDDKEQSDENNAASIVVPVQFEDGRTEEWLLMFKNETHNHPTEIEPVGGAATCLGGAIRDPLSGRAAVIMGMRVTGAADPREKLEDTLKGKLPQRLITTNAAIGFSGYGNQIGVPTLKVHEYYDDRYKAKRMEVGFVAGAVRRENVRRETPAPGDVVIVLGGATGRDGIGGAKGSSVVHDEQSVSTRGAEVQKGNPVIERHIQRLFNNPVVSRLIKRCNDFGAGGASVAIGEIAKGVTMDLNALRTKYAGLNGTELAISESQERMAVVVSREDAQAFIDAANAENLDAVITGHVTEEEVLVEKWNDEVICELDREFLEGGWAPRSTEVEIADPGDVLSYFVEKPENVTGETLREKWLSNLQRLEVASQRGLQQRFDSTVGANTVVGPFGGLYQATPSEAAVTAFPAEGTKTRFATAESYDPALAIQSPYHGGMYAVVDSVAKLVATGASPEKVRLTFQNYFEKMSDPERWAKPFVAQLGAREAQKNLEAFAIGGKDSMSGTFMNSETGDRLDVPPTLVSFAVGVMQEEKIVPSCFQEKGSTVVHLRTLMNEAGEPDWEMMTKMWKKVHELQQSGVIRSTQAVHAGGVAAALSTMTLGNRIGMELGNTFSDDTLFAARYGSMVLEVSAGVNAKALFSDLPHDILGTTGGESITIENEQKSTTSLWYKELQEKWEQPLDGVFPIAPLDRGDGSSILRPVYPHRSNHKHHIRSAKPRVSVLTFPGTNCENDTAAAFNRAGGVAKPVLFLDRTLDAVHQSIENLVLEISESQIIVLPGGFSGGDHPDGSAKFIASVLRNPKVQEAIQNHIEKGGLILGICNGFQALVKSCLLPDGRIRILGADDPTLTHNDKGHFLSMNVNHKVTSLLSPWMAEFKMDELVDIPVAHGEGKIIQVPDSLWMNGQVPFQYAGRDGQVRHVFPDNPNGSTDAIAALTDSTGHIFGMMGHPERAIDGRSVHIPTERKGQRIFDAGVGYFR